MTTSFISRTSHYLKYEDLFNKINVPRRKLEDSEFTSGKYDMYMYIYFKEIHPLGPIDMNR